MLVYLEGIDGVGKSTQISLLKEKLNCICTYEPGATKFGKKLREILLNDTNFSKKAELLLFLADRAEHFEKILKPNLDKLILCDRGFISGIAYALANEPNLSIIELINLNKFTLNNFIGDKFIFFKIDEISLINRLKSRNLDDKIESRGIKYLMQVQENIKKILEFLDLPFLDIDATQKPDIITRKITEYLR